MAKPLKRQAKFVADNIKFFVLFFRENKYWHFMWIVCQADDSHGMSRLVFSEKSKKNKKKQKKTKNEKKKKKNSSAAFVIGTLRINT